LIMSPKVWRASTGGAIDVFDVDELIERYQRAARKLSAFGGSSGSDWQRAADMLVFMRENGETHDW
jgi:hypothetical protein